MKKIYLVLCTVCFWFTTYSQTKPDSSAIFHFSFNSGSTEDSGKKLKIITKNNFSGTDFYGFRNNTLGFNGKTSSAILKDSINQAIQNSDFSTSFQIYLNDYSNNNASFIFQKRSDDKLHQISLSITGIKAKKIAGYLCFNSISNNTQVAYSKEKLETKRWYSVVLTYSKEKQIFKIYIDGELDSETKNFQPFWAKLGTEWLLGKDYANDISYLNGKIDEFAMYKVCLSAKNIKRIYAKWDKSEQINTTENLQNGLIAWYPFNGNADDKSIYENHGASHNCSLTRDRFGMQSSACYFNGTNGFIEVSNALQFDSLQQLTLSLWVKADEPYSEYTGLLCKNVMNGSFMCGFKLTLNNFNFPALYLGLNDADYKSKKCETSLDTGKWYHLAAVYTGKRMMLYINGNSEKSVFYNGGIEKSNASMKIGWDDCVENPRFFHGAIDDIRIYNRALTDNEIQGLMNADTALWSNVIEALVETKFAKWNVKGRYEKTVDYQKRIATTEIQKLRNTLKSEIIDSIASNLFSTAKNNVRLDYDADKEFFTLNYPGFLPLTIEMPIKKAPEFDILFPKLIPANFKFSFDGDKFIIENMILMEKKKKRYTFGSKK